MPRIDPARRADVVRLLKLGWRPDAIVEQLHSIRPYVRKTSRLTALTRADIDALLKLLLHNGWKYLDKIQYWLYHEHNLTFLVL